jgi:imidazole glycerol-phosphate synthase subunit HisF
MLSKRIIPCLDIKEGRTVKGTNFVELRDAGDPVELAAIYASEGADELVFLDITATVDARKTLLDLVKAVASTIDIPFCVGGGISSVADVSALLSMGADKISINSSAVRDPALITTLAKEFGSQCIVVAIDTRKIDGKDYVHTHGGRKATDIQTQFWLKHVEELGAGEILLTSMDADGTKAGFALDITQFASENLQIPIIASGGGGTVAHFEDAFKIAKADACLAASIFHYKEISIPELKLELSKKGIAIRL